MSQLICGDCLEEMPTLPKGSVDMILCDPPYGTTQCKWDSIIPLTPMWKCIEDLIKPNAAIVLMANQPFTSALGASGIHWLRYSWTWHKSRVTGHLNAKKMPMKSTEDVLVFYEKLPTYNPQGCTPCDRKVWNSRSDSERGKTTDPTSTVTGGIEFKEYTQNRTNYPKTLLTIASAGKTVHPTQKPVALMEYLIKTYTNEGETVLDFAMGSGTTGVACKHLNRKFIGIELDDFYFIDAKIRIESE